MRVTNWIFLKIKQQSYVRSYLKQLGSKYYLYQNAEIIVKGDNIA